MNSFPEISGGGDRAPETAGNITPFVRPGDRPETQRSPPHNESVEMALLAALLHNNLVLERVSDFLRPEHFASELHGRLYRDISRLVDRGQIADPRTLHPLFMSYDQVKNSKGAIPESYLMELATHLVAVRNAEVYGKMVSTST